MGWSFSCQAYLRYFLNFLFFCSFCLSPLFFFHLQRVMYIFWLSRLFNETANTFDLKKIRRKPFNSILYSDIINAYFYILTSHPSHAQLWTFLYLILQILSEILLYTFSYIRHGILIGQSWRSLLRHKEIWQWFRFKWRLISP